MRRAATSLALGAVGTALAVFAFAGVLAIAGPAEARRCSGCGCNGGPGYRAPNGKCVGWADLNRICGTPPTKRCKAEIVNTPPPPKPKRRT